MADRRRPARKRLHASVAADDSPALVVPTRWVKAVVGLFLLPPAYILTAAFFSAFAEAAVEHHFWATEPFWFFTLGAVLWLIIFFSLPHFMVVYVFGHELTHALTVLLMGGWVSDFRVRLEGGYIVSNKINTWIALSPYFIPIYSVMVVAVFGLGDWWWGWGDYLLWFYGALGFTWCFHASYTVSMIPKGQSDLAYNGTFFSLVLIYLMNLLILCLLLIAAAPHVGFVSFGRDLVAHASHFAADAAALLDALLRR